jgi:hypothetical protein
MTKIINYKTENYYTIYIIIIASLGSILAPLVYYFNLTPNLINAYNYVLAPIGYFSIVYSFLNSTSNQELKNKIKSLFNISVPASIINIFIIYLTPFIFTNYYNILKTNFIRESSRTPTDNQSIKLASELINPSTFSIVSVFSIFFFILGFGLLIHFLDNFNKSKFKN